MARGFDRLRAPRAAMLAHDFADRGARALHFDVLVVAQGGADRCVRYVGLAVEAAD